jgi:hypothetical protein
VILKITCLGLFFSLIYNDLIIISELCHQKDRMQIRAGAWKSLLSEFILASVL